MILPGRRREIRFSENLRTLRARSGLTQRELGKAVGLDGVSISRIETQARDGKKSGEKTYLHTAVILSEYFGVTLDEMVFGSPWRNEPHRF